MTMELGSTLPGVSALVQPGGETWGGGRLRTTLCEERSLDADSTLRPGEPLKKGILEPASSKTLLGSQLEALSVLKAAAQPDPQRTLEPTLLKSRSLRAHSDFVPVDELPEAFCATVRDPGSCGAPLEATAGSTARSVGISPQKPAALPAAAATVRPLSAQFYDEEEDEEEDEEGEALGGTTHEAAGGSGEAELSDSSLGPFRPGASLGYSATAQALSPMANRSATLGYSMSLARTGVLPTEGSGGLPSLEASLGSFSMTQVLLSDSVDGSQVHPSGSPAGSQTNGAKGVDEDKMKAFIAAVQGAKGLGADMQGDLLNLLQDLQ